MKLAAYLKSMGIPKNTFAKKLGTSFSVIQYLINETHSCNLALALRIEKLTEGKVTCEELVLPKDIMKFNSETRSYELKKAKLPKSKVAKK